MVVDARQAAVRPETPWVRVHHESMVESLTDEVWMMVSKPVRSTRLRWASVIRQESERMESVVELRPVICRTEWSWY